MLSKNEANALAMTLKRDLDRLDADLFGSVIKLCKHWDFLRDEVIDAETVAGTIVRREDADHDAEAARLETEGVISDLRDDLEKARAKIDELREKLGYQTNCLDRLQEAIVRREVDEAIDLLREIFPEHPFLSAAAEHMLAGIHGQGTLAL